jgi:hypothetical protein
MAALHLPLMPLRNVFFLQGSVPGLPMALAVLFKDGGPTASNPEWLNKFYNTLGEVGDKPEELAKGMKMEEISASIERRLGHSCRREKD